MKLPIRLLALALLTVVACAGDDGPATDAGHDGGMDGGADGGMDAARDTSTDGSGGDGGVPDGGVDADTSPSGTRTIAACAGGDTGDLPCSFEYLFDEAGCADRGCDKLAIYFAGGGQTCAGAQLSNYVEDGYVAVCALLFGDSAEAGRYPYNAEAERVDHLIRSVARDPAIASAWDGTSLLITGASHGATAPVVAMARTDFDEDPAWHGTVRTGACFYDGIYDIEALDELLGSGDDGAPCPDPPAGVLSHRRAVGRYYESGPVVSHVCDNDQCFCDGDHSPEMDEDTVVDVEATRFAVTEWKLVECGSALDACTADVVPGDPIRSLCSNIDASPTHQCTFQSLPRTPHGACAPGVLCRSWFNGL
ncbi:MAG: hypothetical protein DRJ42_30670 [Deltaproteobacteria bacterium]|nr:MAG: hypothetical protein DRJ42_30670 [Deltaproteobacteria bacterium]